MSVKSLILYKKCLKTSYSGLLKAKNEKKPDKIDIEDFFETLIYQKFDTFSSFYIVWWKSKCIKYLFTRKNLLK